jgi:(1->4)-alpha-D-glucan 1-alpha-D-glucosylmutase
MRSIHRHWPETLNATSTHDTKRSEDVGARINVLSEIPDEWSEKLQRWGAANEKLKRKVKGTAVPEKNMEVLLYQTLIGAWPLQDGDLGKFRERIRNYMLKAVREAKVQTRWVRPNPDYEKALSNFVNSILSEGPRNKFLPDIQAFQDRIGPHGAINALSQLLIKITAPGTPDFYQGTEVWNLRLVDPDNREPVDFNAHQQLMRKLDARSAGVARYAVQDLMRNWRDGMIKLFLTSRALSVRREMPQAFRGDYIPLRAIGERAENVCSFARCRGSQWAVLVVPRFSTQVMRFENDRLTQQDWGETAVVMPANAPERLTDAFTGETWEPHAAGRERRLEIHPLFAALPFALLTTAR